MAMALVAASCSSGSDPESVAEPDTTPEIEEAAPTEEPTSDPTPVPEPTEVPPPTAPGTAPAVAVPAFPDDDDVLPFDEEVLVGELDNGLRYYIRRNTAPGLRAELRLAVDAGSALEDDDQSGVAHFLEHMLFNGTTEYPALELISVLESFGSEFGPDINAYTSFDETVYSLSVPTDDEVLFAEALGVLREWASEALIDPDEVVAERGVVFDEWRVRSQGLNGRVTDLYVDLLLTGTSLEGRLPIGDPEAIEVMEEEPLRRFYEDWYRPDLMAVVVVGDIDPPGIEASIRDLFGDLDNPEDARLPAPDEIPEATTFGYRLLADEEVPNAGIEVIYPGSGGPTTTVGEYRRSMAAALASSVIDQRFADDVLRGEAPFLSASVSSNPFARGLDAPSLTAQGEAADLLPSLEALLVELQRVRRDGFTADEVMRAIEARRTDVEQFYAGRATHQDVSYADEYVDVFLGGEGSLSWDDWIALERRLLDEMTADYIQAAYLAGIGGRAPQVAVIGPADDADDLPTEDEVIAVFDAVAEGSAAGREDDSADVERLMAPPAPADIVVDTDIPELEARRLEFANGVTVVLKTTEIADEAFVIDGVSPGGLSALETADLAGAFVLPDVIGTSGLGDIDQVSLDRLLSEVVAGAGLSFDQTHERVQGGGSTEDAELALQLTHLLLTAANATDPALQNAVGELRPFLEAPEELPFLASTVALFDLRYGGDPRFRYLPSADAVDTLDTGGLLDLHERAFGNNAGAVFAVVGDFDMAEMVDLVARYLGTLPGDGDPDEWVDLQPDPPSGVQTRELAVGQDPQGAVTVLFTEPLDVDQQTELELEALENILGARIRDRIREALGATYSPSVFMGAVDEPDRLVETFIEVTGDPAGLDQIVEELDIIVADLVSGGITDAEASTAAEQIRRNAELVTNGFWVDRIQRAERRPDEAPLTVPERVRFAAAITADDLNELAAAVLSVEDYLVVTRGPEA